MYISTDILLYYIVISMIIVTGIQIYVVPSLCICCYSMLVTLFIALHKFNYVIAVSFNNCTLINYQSSLLLMFSTNYVMVHA